MVSDNGPVLTGWKAIAGFVNRDQRTAMRWASERGLPIRRVPGGKRGSVYALPAEIAQWLAVGAEHSVESGAGPEDVDASIHAEAPLAPAAESLSACIDDDASKLADMPPPPPRRTARWSAAIAAAALAGAAVAAGSIEFGLLSIGSASGGTMPACQGSAGPR